MRFAASLIAVAWLVFGSSPSQASDWSAVTKSETGTIVLIDYHKVRVTNGQVAAWLKLDHSQDRSTAARTSMWHVKFHCDEWTYRILRVVEYSRSGTTLNESSMPDFEDYQPMLFRAITPDTVIETAGEMACVWAGEALGLQITRLPLGQN